MRTFTALACLMLIARAALSQPGVPTYSGEVCFSGSSATVTVTADPTATAILIYPTPPGGGYFMDNDGSGTFSKTFSGVPSGADFRFRLVVQAPAQHEYPDHVVSATPGCTPFASGDDGNPGGGGGGNGGGGPGSGGPLPMRGFRHDVIEANGAWAVRIETASPASPIPAVVGVDLRYRVNEGPIRTETMNPIGNFFWELTLPDAGPGDELSYSFTETIGQALVDTAWFERTVGEAAPPEPEHPIVTVAGLRFRDRHENEWRFDHFPAGYDVGRTFDVQITDHGDRLDVEVLTAPEVPVPAIDMKWYSQSGPLGFCDRNNSAVGVRMAGGNGRFYSTIDGVVHGQRVDIEFTLLATGQTYYSEFIFYYVGDGRLQQQVQNPLAYAAGDASISTVTVKQFAFNQHAMNLPPDELRAFMDGKIIFETRWDDGLLFNPPTAFDCNGGPVGFDMGPSPVFTPGLLGPRYTNNSCIECHMLDGRGRAPTSAADTVEDYLFRLSIPGAPGAAPTPHPLYGVQLDTKAVPGVQPEGRASIAWETVGGVFDDGTPYELRRPVASFTDLIYGEIGSNIPGEAIDGSGVTPYDGEAELSVRIAPMLAGLGLLEAVDETEILAYADPNDADGDGISGRANYVEDLASGGSSLGRFGWKAGQPSLRQQAAAAFAHDMGMTSSEYGDGAEVSAAELDQVESYLRGLTLPPRENFDDPAALAGKVLFETAGCVACHRPALRTASDAAFAPFRGQLIQPFTDMLLHDMGEGLADDRPEFGASGREWRTPPLWGIGYVGHVLGTPSNPFDPNGNPDEPNYLHDGRARSLMEAILWHGGEAQAARDAVLAMDSGERTALIAYVEYPFIDPANADAYAGTPPCSDGDLVLPYGVLDLADINAFVTGFLSQEPLADLVAPFGVWDLQDVSAFVNAFVSGCP